jgi:hypothetical protein
MSREAERAHLAKAKRIESDMESWSDSKLNNFRFPWPRGALRVTQLKPGYTYTYYNIDNINPQSADTAYYVGKRGDEQVFRFDNARGGEWGMYKYGREWVCCSGADRLAFFGPYSKDQKTKSKAKPGTKARPGRKGPAASALNFAIGARKQGLDGEMWRVVRVHLASRKLSQRWQHVPAK